MASFTYVNFVNTTVSAALSSTATTVTIASTAGLPTSIPAGAPIIFVLNDVATRAVFEVVYATAISGSNLTIERGQEGTTAQSWNVGDYIFASNTEGLLSSLAPLASPQFTGTPTVPTPTAGTDNTQAANTAWTRTYFNPGRFLGVQIFTSSGTYTPTAGTNSVVVEVQGGGASGGAIGAVPSGSMGISGAGSSGTYGKGRFLSGFSGVAVTVGAGGAAAAVGNNPGNNGGTSSFGSLLTAPGGIAGGAGASVTPPTSGGGGSIPAAASGALFSIQGRPAGYSLAISSNVGHPSVGGASVFGAGGQAAPESAGTGGEGYGAGGSGVAIYGGAANGQPGGVGASGVVIVWEFA